MDNNLKAIRKAHGKSQAIVAEELGITLSSYRKWERGETRLFGDNLVTLSGYFNCSVDDILGTSFAEGITADRLNESEKARSFSNMALGHMNEKEKVLFTKLTKCFLELSEKGQTEILEFSDTLVRSGKYAKFGKFTFSKEDHPLQAS